MRWKVIHLGTTSARYATDEKLMDVFEALKDFKKAVPGWDSQSQLNFSRFLQNRGLYSGNVSSNDKLQKNARQISSMFEQLGFVNSTRELTSLGEYALENGDDEFIPILRKSQAAFLMGVFNYKDEDGVFSFRRFLKDISTNGSISKDVFKREYLTINGMSDQELTSEIQAHLPINNFNDFKRIVHHQKGDKYNKKYFNFFEQAINHGDDSILLWNQLTKVASGPVLRELKKTFFGTSIKKEISSPIVELSPSNVIKGILNSKLRALLVEYSDLAYRVFRCSGIFYFDADTIYISKDIAAIFNEAEWKGEEAASTQEIVGSYISQRNKHNFRKQMIEDRANSFEKYLDSDLTLSVVKGFLSDMQQNDWTRIARFFGNSSGNPTYAEFLTSVAFHYASGRKANFLKSWNGKLRADNMPHMHAGGGVPDSSFKINGVLYLIEATLQTGRQQMANEIGSISEHLLDSEGIEKKAYLIAGRISNRSLRQASIQRFYGVDIYPIVFEDLATALVKEGPVEEISSLLIDISIQHSFEYEINDAAKRGDQDV